MEKVAKAFKIDYTEELKASIMNIELSRTFTETNIFTLVNS